jgi:hypothetical protein
MSVKTGLAVQDHDAVSGTHKVGVLGLVEGGLLRFGRADGVHLVAAPFRLPSRC